MSVQHVSSPGSRDESAPAEKTPRRAGPSRERPLEVQHFVLTRFSYRDSPDHDWQGRGNDPLDPRRLALRFTIFEIACLPNVLAQTNQNFDWIVIIDKDLPREDRERLKKGLGKRPRTHIHQFVPGENLGRLDWLTPYRSTPYELYLTTNLDDDDAVPLTFVEAIQAHISGLGTEAPALKTFGCRRISQWEFISSSERPLGSVSSWHRSNFIQSVGFSLLCRHPFGDVSVYATSHVLADIWFEKARGAQLEELLRQRWQVGAIKGRFWSRQCSRWLDAFQARLGRNFAESEALEPRSVERLFHNLGRDFPESVVVTNHLWNEQGSRLFESKPVAPVIDARTFPNMEMDLELFRKHSTMFGKTWKVVGQTLREGLEPSPRVGFLRRLALSMRRILYFARWILRD